MTPDQALEDLKRRGLLRGLKTLPENRGRFLLNGETWLNFSSNDYLDLAHHPALKAAAIRAVEDLGCSAAGSRLTSGHLAVHESLETALAAFTGMEAALIFGSGFLTNLGVIPALAGDRATIFCDRLNHASLIDGALMAGVKWHRYRHNDTAHLDELLNKHPAAEGETRLVITDSVFSMDGDVAPLAEVAEIAQRHGALLIVNRARSFIYSTGLPPAVIAASHAALDLFVEARGALGDDLMDRARHMHALLAEAGFAMPPFASPILPVMVGDNHAALDFSARLAERRILCGAIRPPTVPPGTARLRLTVTRAHEAADLAFAADAFAEVGRALGLLR